MKSTCSCGKFPATRAKNLSRVLVIDDEPLVRWSLVAGLRHAGIDAVAAGAPEEARAITRQVPPDVVLLDISLWGVDTRRLCEEIRLAAPASHIMLLAVEGQDVLPPAWDAVDVIRKPFDLNAVVSRVEQVLSCPAHGAKLAV